MGRSVGRTLLETLTDMRWYVFFALLSVVSGCTLRRSPTSQVGASPSLAKDVFVAACSSTSRASEVILAQALMRSIGTSDCQVAWQELQKKKNITLSGFGIQDLKLLSIFPQIEELALTDNEISDLVPLGGVAKLKKLNLSFNGIRSLAGLEHLASLEELSLMGNKLELIAEISALKNLKVLDISENRIHDLSPLARLSNLGILVADDNDLKDLSSLQSLTSLEQLSIERNRVESLRPLSGLARLQAKRLKVNGNPIRKEECPTFGESSAVTSYCLSLRGLAP